MTLVYIGDDLLDLYPNTVIAYTVQKIDVASFPKRNVSYTNTIQIPWTNNNRTIFGNPQLISSSTSQPYTALTCKVIQDGVTIIPDGICFLRTSTKTSGEIFLYENIYDFFSTVNNLNISEIEPFSNSAWTAAGIDAARANTSGIISAVIDWGKGGTIFQLNYFLPSFHYHSLVTSILEYTGLTASGSILTDDDFLDLAIPFPGEDFEYPETYVEPFKAQGRQAGGDIVLGQVLTGTRLITFDTVDYGTKINNGTDSYTFDADVNCTVTATIRLNPVTWNLATYVRVQILQNSTEVAAYQLNFPTTDSGVQVITYTGDFASGDVVKMNIFSDQGSVPNGANVTVVNGWTFNFNPTTSVARSNVNWNQLLPEVSCKDILTDFFNRFSLIPKQQGTTLILKSLQEILSDTAGAVDWSEKKVNEGYEITFESDYSQNNYFTYDDSEGNNPNLGRGNLQVSNTNLPAENEVFQSVFGNSRTEVNSFDTSYNVAVIPVYDSGSTGIADFINEPGLRLVTLKDRTTETAITFNASSRTDYRLGYFVDATLAKDTGWEYFLGQYYERLETSLQKNKIVECYFRLSPVDIANFDPHKMIWDGHNYYLVNKINNFVSGKITKVELFKVG